VPPSIPAVLEEEHLPSCLLQSTGAPKKLGDMLSSLQRGLSQARRPDWLQRGEKVGPYEIQDRVGVGGFGALYRATRDGKDYALKIPLSKPDELESSEREAAEERLGREVGTLLMVHDPNVVRVREFFRWPNVESGFLCIVMDFVHGHPFYRWRREANPSLRAILSALSRLGGALHGLHRHNIHHRDIKSANVLVTDDGSPVLVDFGIARPRSAFTVTREATLLGTYTHWAPEYVAFLQSAAFDSEPFPYAPTTDLYALGNMAYGALCGREPHWYADAESASGILPGTFVDALLGDRLEPPSKHNPAIPAEVDAICLKLLAKRPEERFQTGGELAAEIDALLGREKANRSYDVPLAVPPAPSPSAKSDAPTRGRTRPPPLPPASVSLGVSMSAVPEARLPVAAEPAPALRALVPPPLPVRPSRRVQRSRSQAKPTNKLRAVRDPVPDPPPARKTAGKSPEAFAPSIDAAAVFVSPVPVPEPKVEAAVAREIPALSSTVAAATRYIKETTASPRPRWMAGLGVGGGLLCFAVLALALSAPLPKTGAAPRSLLTQLEKDAAARFHDNPPPPAFEAPAPGVSAELQASEEEAPVSPKPRRRRGNPDAQQVDALMAKEYGNRPLAKQSRAADLPSWMKPGKQASNEKESGEVRVELAGVPMGAEIPVRLQKPLDSRTVGSGPVVGRLPRAFVLRGRVVLPTGTMVYGAASASGAGRFDVRFNRLRLPDNRELSFEGLAMDANDRKPGLFPSRRISISRSAPGLVSRLIKGTASGVLGKVTGGDGVDVARSAGETVLGHEDGDSALPSEALLLDAPVDFSVFVTTAF
jgi:serine/threonine protein kinase